MIEWVLVYHEEENGEKDLKGLGQKSLPFHIYFPSQGFEAHKEGYPSFLFLVLASSQWVERVPNVTVPHIYLWTPAIFLWFLISEKLYFLLTSFIYGELFVFNVTWFMT